MGAKGPNTSFVMCVFSLKPSDYTIMVLTNYITFTNKQVNVYSMILVQVLLYP